MNPTPTIFSSLLALGFVAGASPAGDAGRTTRHEGYLRFEDSSDGGSESSSFTVVPAPRSEIPADAAPASEPAPVPDALPAPVRPRPAPCVRWERKFATRLAEVRGTAAPSAGPDEEPLSPAIQRALFGRTALHAAGDRPMADPIPELTWDSDLRDLYRAYRKCLHDEEKKDGSDRRGR